MADRKLISVIVPVYNGEAYIESCIESILRQSYPAVEILVVNDGSTDRTEAICRQLEEQHDSLKVITMADKGVSAARNQAMGIASGEYLTFVDADDRIHPELLSGLMQIIESTGAGIAGCGFFIWEKEEAWEQQKQQKPTDLVRKLYTGREFIEKGILAGNTRCWGKLYDRQAIDHIRFQEGLTIGEDMMFLLDLALQGAAFAEVKAPYYGYYKNPAGAMLRTFQDSYMDQILCWEEARDKIMAASPFLTDQASAVLLTSILLTVGKIAVLPFKEINRHHDKLMLCRHRVRTVLKETQAKSLLSKGYRMKAAIFPRMPMLYTLLYHFIKSAH